MSFISNIFLWLLPLVSIPLIIHLLNRRRIIQMDFSSIYFLESLKTNSMRRINILQWLLLAIRTIIILIIILMISRPVLKGYYPSMETSPSSSMSVIVIDDSFSLSGNINNESRLSLINEKYNQVLDSFDEKTQICVISLSRGVLYDGININLPDLSRLISISNKKGELYNYINIINQKFDKSIINKEIFIITDGQANLFNSIASEEVENWNIYFILLDKLKSNLKINSVKIGNDIIVKDKVVDIEVEVENNGLTKVENSMVSLFINNINVGLQNISIEPGNKKNIIFSTVFSNYNDNLLKISIAEDDNNSDNEYYLNIHIPNKIKVLSLVDDLNNSKYISNVVRAINKKNNIFEHDVISYLDLSYSNLQKYDTIIIYDYKAFEFHYNYFEEYLNSNHIHLIIFPEYNNSLEQLYGILESDASGDYISLEDDTYERVNYLDFNSHADLDSDNKIEDFIRVFKYIKSSIGPNSIVSMENSNSFWDQIHFGSSKVDIFFSSLHLNWNDFPIKGMFVQFIYELLNSGYDNYNYNKYIEEDFLLRISDQNNINKIKHKKPNSNIEYIPISSGNFDVKDINIPGVHEFYNDSHLLYSLAVNIHSDELLSNLLTNQEINDLIGHDCYFFRSEKSIAKSIINTREGYEIWRYLLWMLCFMIIIEMIISNGNKKT